MPSDFARRRVFSRTIIVRNACDVDTRKIFLGIYEDGRIGTSGERAVPLDWLRRRFCGRADYAFAKLRRRDTPAEVTEAAGVGGCEGWQEKLRGDRTGKEDALGDRLGGGREMCDPFFFCYSK